MKIMHGVIEKIMLVYFFFDLAVEWIPAIKNNVEIIFNAKN